MTQSLLVVTFEADPENRAIIAEVVGDVADIVYLRDVEVPRRHEVLKAATVVLSRQTANELRSGEYDLIGGARLLQFVTAGVDYVPLAGMPAGLPIACNGGAYAEPMAEHALAMALAAMKRLFVEHAKVAAGTFDQHRRNRMLAGSVCGILGFGGVGVATARLMKCLGAKVHALNRSGVTAEPVDWIGNGARLDELLRVSDVVVVSVPLTPATEGMIGRRELELMKPDAVLINLARGEIIEEAALFAHLERHPEFTACIDAWWVEPIRHGRFRMNHDFTSLPNVIASPHNSASGVGYRDVGLRRALANAARALKGEAPLHLVGPDDRMQ
ncbi:MAG: NAD(P)-dependent oxidoreductase [Pseudorhodoplanes sp.]